jgi:hypothetical protein
MPNHWNQPPKGKNVLNLNPRKCFLGIRSSTKSKHHDGTELKILNIDLEQIELERAEVNSLLGEPRAWESLFNIVNGKAEPFIKCIKGLQLAESIDQAFVCLTYGVHARVVELKDVKLSKVTLELVDGKVFLSCKVRGPAVLDEHFGDFMDKLGDSIECEMRFEQPGQQQDLPLNKIGANESATPSLGTPKEEREKAHAREREIAAELETAHVTNDGKKKKSRGSDPVVKTEKVDTAKRRKSVDGATVN